MKVVSLVSTMIFELQRKNLVIVVWTSSMVMSVEEIRNWNWEEKNGQMFCLFSISFVCWSETFLRLYRLLRNGLLSSFSLFQSNGKAIVKFSAGIPSCLDTQVVLSVSFYDCYPFCSCIMIFGERRRSSSFSFPLFQSFSRSVFWEVSHPNAISSRNRRNTSECIWMPSRVPFAWLPAAQKSRRENIHVLSTIIFFLATSTEYQRHWRTIFERETWRRKKWR